MESAAVSPAPYGSLIARHAARLQARPDREKTAQLLEACDLRIAGEEAKTKKGLPPSSEDAYHYKQKVRELFGDLAFSSAKVNFILGGCKCRDCVRT